MIENLQDELQQLEHKQAKGAKLRGNITQCALVYQPLPLSCQATP